MILTQDTFERTFKTLRVSLTNTCNLACNYCVNPSVKNKNDFDKSDLKLLSNDEYLNIIQSLHKTLNLETIRLTGGEPLLYKSLVPLIEGIKKIGIEKIKLTTNAALLNDKAFELKKAGVYSINVSLDAVDDDISFKINKRRNLKKILSGIQKAIDAGIHTKVNCVVMKGFNDEHFMEVFEYCKQQNITVRFLELMQMGHLYDNHQDYFFSEEDILNKIELYYRIKPVPRETGATSNYWIANDGYKFGIIANESSPFCSDCNRLRLDSYGNIYGCLSDNTPIPLLDSFDNEQLLKTKLNLALSQKKIKFSGSKLSMIHIGG